ncbi:MAG: hypothetical protein KGH64_03225 [Candidatus Micrarchaeota archaeon]|nr:hypothetical protein [Candidatus Micrarchaeota archaeon]MDE1834324.1 hypothetical protein [Candidatus Micrarchaeota archaeon]MDE1859101.1 hypothetical protein [Candidatus Micrarchaeota archaeon]
MHVKTRRKIHLTAELDTPVHELRRMRAFWGVYRTSQPVRRIDVPVRSRFHSFVGMKEHFDERIRDPHDPRRKLEIVRVRGVPIAWKNDMDKLINAYRRLWGDDGSLTPVGELTFSIYSESRGIVAETSDYFPKDYFFNSTLFPGNKMCKAAPGLSYATEWIALENLKQTVTHVRTSDWPSSLREKQLERVGLVTNKAMPIEKWLDGMISGFNASLREHRRKFAQKK